jgi:hypothetical protein
MDPKRRGEKNGDQQLIQLWSYKVGQDFVGK